MNMGLSNSTLSVSYSFNKNNTSSNSYVFGLWSKTTILNCFGNKQDTNDSKVLMSNEHVKLNNSVV